MRKLRASARHNYFEDILDGRADSSDPLTHLVDLARGAPSAEETAGLTAAMAVFASSAGMPPTEPLAAGSEWRRSRGRLGFTVKSFAAATVASKLLVGVAAAAVATSITVVAVSASRPTHPSSGELSSLSLPTSRTTPGAASSGTTVEPTRGRATSARPSHGAPKPSTAPAPSLIALCRAWSARPHQHGNADNSAAFGRLIAAAGAADQVDAYCATLGHESKPKPSKPKPTKTHATGKPAKTEPAKTEPAKPQPTKAPKPTKTKAPKPTKTHATGKPTKAPSPTKTNAPKPTKTPTPAKPTKTHGP